MFFKVFIENILVHGKEPTGVRKENVVYWRMSQSKRPLLFGNLGWWEIEDRERGNRGHGRHRYPNSLLFWMVERQGEC